MYLHIPDPEGCVWDHRFEFWIDLPPVTWKRPEPGICQKTGKLYQRNNKEMEKQQQLIRELFYSFCCREGRQFNYPWEGVAIINIVSYIKRPKSLIGKHKPCRARKDVDNLGKLVIDALQCICRVRLVTPKIHPVTGKKIRSIRSRRFGAWDDDKNVVYMGSGKTWTSNQYPNQDGSWVTIDFYREIEPEYAHPLQTTRAIRKQGRKSISKPGQLCLL